MTSSPYVLDAVSVAVGSIAFHRRRPLHPFALGVGMMLLCLRPTFDIVSETVAFALGGRGDLYHLARAIGRPTVWSSMTLLFGYSLFTIARVVVVHATAPAGTLAIRWER